MVLLDDLLAHISIVIQDPSNVRWERKLLETYLRQGFNEIAKMLLLFPANLKLQPTSEPNMFKLDDNAFLLQNVFLEDKLLNYIPETGRPATVNMATATTISVDPVLPIKVTEVSNTFYYTWTHYDGWRGGVKLLFDINKAIPHHFFFGKDGKPVNLYINNIPVNIVDDNKDGILRSIIISEEHYEHEHGDRHLSESEHEKKDKSSRPDKRKKHKVEDLNLNLIAKVFMIPTFEQEIPKGLFIQDALIEYVKMKVYSDDLSNIEGSQTLAVRTQQEFYSKVQILKRSNAVQIADKPKGVVLW